MSDLGESSTVENFSKSAGANPYAIGLAYALGLLVLTVAAYFPSFSGEYIWTDWSNVGAGKRVAKLAELSSYWTESETEQ